MADLSKLPCPEGYEWRLVPECMSGIRQTVDAGNMVAMRAGPGESYESQVKRLWRIRRGSFEYVCEMAARLHRVGRDEPVRWAEPPGGWGGMGLRHRDDGEDGVPVHDPMSRSLVEVVLPEWPVELTAPRTRRSGPVWEAHDESMAAVREYRRRLGALDSALDAEAVIQDYTERVVRDVARERDEARAEVDRLRVEVEDLRERQRRALRIHENAAPNYRAARMAAFLRGES